MSLTLPSHPGSHSLPSHWREGSKRKKWGRREGEWMSLTCLQPFAHRPLRWGMWISEGHYRIPWFFASESLDNRNHLRFASATGGRPFRFLLAPRPHVAEEASASFGACLRLLRATSLKPSDCLSNTCLSYYSKRNFEYSWSISDNSESIEQQSRLLVITRYLASLDVKKFRSLDFSISVNIKNLILFFFTINAKLLNF